MSTQFSIDEIIENLTSDDLNDIVNMLRMLEYQPTGDKRVIPYIKTLLIDDRIHIVGIPIMYGSIKWLAAQVLRVEQKACGISEPVIIRDAFVPLSQNQLGKLCMESGLCKDLSTKDSIAVLIKNNIIILRDFKYPSGF